MAEILSQLYEKLSNYPIDPPNEPPPGGYQHFVLQEEVTIDLLEAHAQHRQEGQWLKREYQWIAIENIKCQDTWKPASLAYASSQIQSSGGLKPVRLYATIPFDINNGIHRINALKSASYTHVLAVMLDIVEQRPPPLPSEAAPYIEELITMYLNEKAASTLQARVNKGPVYILIPHNRLKGDIHFSILRSRVHTGNVEMLPTDCKLKVVSQSVDNSVVGVTGRLFDKEVNFSGSIQSVIASLSSEISAICTQLGVSYIM